MEMLGGWTLYLQASNEAVALLEMSKEKWPVLVGNKKWQQESGTALPCMHNAGRRRLSHPIDNFMQRDGGREGG